ncbi:MAG: nucleotidyltransferase domain-containing protein [Deltaproteobacteria bacterium]|nr:nucleotidyltransferase domain-containing protein [Deltaproteobacteria bacterium]
MNLQGVSRENLEFLKSILRKILEKYNVRVFAFGSRTTERFRENSDLDLLLVSDSKLPLSVFGELRSELEESTLPFRVDLLEEARLPESIRKSVRNLPRIEIIACPIAKGCKKR